MTAEARYVRKAGPLDEIVLLPLYTFFVCNDADSLKECGRV